MPARSTGGGFPRPETISSAERRPREGREGGKEATVHNSPRGDGGDGGGGQSGGRRWQGSGRRGRQRSGGRRPKRRGGRGRQGCGEAEGGGAEVGGGPGRRRRRTGARRRWRRERATSRARIRRGGRAARGGNERRRCGKGLNRVGRGESGWGGRKPAREVRPPSMAAARFAGANPPPRNCAGHPGTLNLGVEFRKKQQQVPQLNGYSDSDMAGDIDDRKSTTGVLFKLGDSLISWQSQKQKVVAISSCEAEYIAAATAAVQGVWLARPIGELEGQEPGCALIKVDNKSAISLLKNPVLHDRSKHIDTKFYFIWDCVDQKRVEVEYIRLEEQHADILTKPLAYLLPSLAAMTRLGSWDGALWLRLEPSRWSCRCPVDAAKPPKSIDDEALPTNACPHHHPMPTGEGHSQVAKGLVADTRRSLTYHPQAAMDPRCLLYPSPPSPSPHVVGIALAPCALALPSPSPLQPCAAVVSAVAVAREDHRRARQVVAVLVRLFAVAGDHRSSIAVVDPKVPAASSSSPSPSVGLPPPFRSPVSSPRCPLRLGALCLRPSIAVRRRACAVRAVSSAEPPPLSVMSPLTSSGSSAVSRRGPDRSRPSVLDQVDLGRPFV
uniref:Retroelement pol polyprotein n=1 Tax=Oryza sativa subsp. japonica TaxID=39947 RepID=Q9AYC4_ORYSJ|nr:Putative retroelement pol polyprotein [Oryza sativa Japonica Group]